MKPITLTLLSLLIFSFVSAQNYKVKSDKKNLILTNNGIVLDSSLKFYFEYKQDTIIQYRSFALRLPDNCANYLLIRESFTYSTGKFIKVNSSSIVFYNSGCRNLFHEENVYCIRLTRFRLKNKTLRWVLEDTENRKLKIKQSKDIFKNDQELNKMIKALNNFLLRKECVEVKYQKRQH